MCDVTNYEKDEILEKIAEALSDNNFDRVDYYISKHKKDYDEPLKNIVLKLALYTNCIPYLEMACENAKFDNSKNADSFFEYVQSQEAMEILIDSGAIPPIEYYENERMNA